MYMYRCATSSKFPKAYIGSCQTSVVKIVHCGNSLDINYFLQNLYQICLAGPKYALNHFMPLVSFDNLWKHQKTKSFQMFSGDIEENQWHEMGQ